MADKTKIGRLAMRQEGEFWNAYYAVPGTMEGAVLLGSITMGAVVGNESRKTIFMDLMRDLVADHIEAITGVLPSWGGPRDCP